MWDVKDVEDGKDVKDVEDGRDLKVLDKCGT